MKKSDKKRRFYTNEHRNQHWTEEPQGRPINFADKYADDGTNGNIYSDQHRALLYKAQKKKEKRIKGIKSVCAFALAIVFILVGYTVMDIHMIRQAKPAENMLKKQDYVNYDVSQISLNLSSFMIEGVSLDNSTMLASVISDTHDFGTNAVTFDAKREDGTIGYQSTLATIDTIGALSSVGNDSAGSIKQLVDNDILPVARICCYKDEIMTLYDSSLAVKKGKKLYKDSSGSHYLNPNNEQVYGYIRDIVRELNTQGVQVFILYGYDLPEDISDKYNDGFKYLSGRLSADLDGQVKLLQEIDVKVKGMDAESGNITNSAIEKETKSFKKLKKDQIYYISTELDNSRVYQYLTKTDISRFVLD